MEQEESYNQSQPLRIISNEWVTHSSARCINSRLWFVNNKELEDYILDYLAKYADKYQVNVYGFTLMGNHYHLVAHYPLGNQSEFHRDFNARIAYGVNRYVAEFEGGPVFERRYSLEVVPLEEDVVDKFYYCALQQVASGIVGDVTESPQYNSYCDAMAGNELVRDVVDWGAYKAAQRKSPEVSKERYTKTYRLRFTLPPGKTKEELYALYEERKKEVAKEHVLGVERSRKVVPGSKPNTTKKSTRTSKRPLVLTRCMETKKKYLDWYFTIYREYKAACARYLKGELDVEFPPGTFRPPLTRLTALAEW